MCLPFLLVLKGDVILCQIQVHVLVDICILPVHSLVAHAQIEHIVGKPEFDWLVSVSQRSFHG